MDHVVKLEFEYFGADPMRLYSSVFRDGPWNPSGTDVNWLDVDLLSIRRVRVTLLVQVASAALREPAGVLSGGPADNLIA